MVIHFDNQEERLRYIKKELEEIVPVEAKKEPVPEEPKKPQRKKEKKDEVQAE